MRKLLVLLALSGAAQAACAQSDVPDPAVVSKIRDEAFNHSQVMNLAFYLTDANGPRLTNSPGYLHAANWAKDELVKWGLKNAALEPWGEFGNGWELEKSYVALKLPYYQPLIAYPKAWTLGTNGPISGSVVVVVAKDSVELEAYRGKLKGKIVLIQNNDTIHPSFAPDAHRFADSDLVKLTEPGPDRQRPPISPEQMAAFRNRGAFQRKIGSFFKEEGALLVLSMGARGKDGTLFVSSGGAYAKDGQLGLPDVVLTAEDYHRITRLVKAGIPVELEAEVKTKLIDNDSKGYNVVAEIPGTDKNLKAQLVMLGGHLDSWHASVGATDNAAGSAVMLEAVRIIKALNLQPKRTIRIALWSGEEEGLFGSRNYVKNHFGDPQTMQLQPEQALVSAYYNVDNGSGKVRGVYLQGNDSVGPIFKQWLAPFGDLGATTLTSRNTGGTDHQSFDGLGIPGFQFIQDPIEYDTRTHHTNMDSYDHLQPEDLKQAAAVVALFVYQTSIRNDKLPRKELPKPRPAGGPMF